MADFITVKLIALVPLLPMLAFAFIAVGMLAGVLKGEARERLTARVTLLLNLAALLLLIAVDVLALGNGTPGNVRFAPWLDTGEFQIHFGFYLDGLSLGMATLVMVIALLTQRFSVNYLHREAGFHRFFMVLNLFTTGMLLIVLAGNAVLTFVGWELAGISSWLLISYAYDRDTASGHANRALITNRIGDAGFILSIFFCLNLLGTASWSAVFSSSPNLSTLPGAMLGLGFLLAAMAKSAAAPFSGWISRALEGPTPSSAVFYGSLMVHAGIYLIIRLEPLFSHVTVLMVLLAIVGVLTAAYGVIGGLVQSDVKTAFIFSTTGQVGLMFLECGLGLFDVAAWHLAAHAAFRAWQFLHAPSYMHWVSPATRPVPSWLANNSRLYNAALQRFWLDNMSNAFIVRPVQSMAKEVDQFDERVVNRLVGLPFQTNAISSVPEWEARTGKTSTIGRGQGVLGATMEKTAILLHWFEEHLVLKGSGEGLLTMLQRIGQYLIRVENLLSQPRYLWLLILATLVIIL